MSTQTADGELLDVRPGRSLWVKISLGSSEGSLYHKKILALLVHGGCANLQQWRSQEPTLNAAGVTTLTFDALGCGRSAKPHSWRAYHPSELYQDLVALFDQKVQEAGVQGHGKVVLIGHSFGAALALRLAAEKQKQIAAVVLIGAYVPKKERPSLRRYFSMVHLLFYLPNWALKWMQPGLTEGFLKAAFHAKTESLQPGLLAQERKYSNANPPYMFKAFHRQVWQLASPEEYAQWASSVAQPVAVIYGDSDCITPLFPNSSRLIRSLQRAELTVLKEASHQVMQEQPDEVNACILQLLKTAL